MNSPYQLAQTVIEALLAADPARLAHLAESGRLVKFLTNQIAAFDLQFARQMQGQPRQAELTVVESLMPMLVEFPTAKQRPTLTPKQNQLVEAALDQYAEEATSQMSYSPEKSADLISD